MKHNKVPKEVSGLRMSFRDHLTFDSNPTRTIDGTPNAYGIPLGAGCTFRDGRTVDSTGAFLVGELERLDQELHAPLADVSWSRDIDLREDVTIADEVSSYTNSTFASAGGLGAGNSVGNGKAWISKTSDQITGVGVDIAKTPHPLITWGIELKYTILELASAAKLGRPVDQQKYEGMQLKHQMDIDEMVYIGDTSLGQTGLINDGSVVVTNVANGASGTPLWSTKTPDEILADVNSWITTVWAASAWAVMPTTLLIPPAQFGYISTAKVSLAGSISILKYIEENSILTTSGKGKLKILPLKWCIGGGVGGTTGVIGHDRAVVYTKDKKRVRYPMTMLQRTPVQFDSIFHKTTYYCRLGCIEVVYQQCMGYFDGL